MTAPSPSATTVRTRSPGAAEHYDALDGIRALAAFGVLVLHVGGDSGNMLDHGPKTWLLSGGGHASAVPWALLAINFASAIALGAVAGRSPGAADGTRRGGCCSRSTPATRTR